MSPELNRLSAEWNAARVLYPTYSALAREFVIDLTPCNDLEGGIEQPPEESVEQARQWFTDMDERIQIHQLRQFLQTTTMVTPQLLQTLLLHHLHKEEKSPADRDKIDFLLVQLFSLAAPSRLEDSSVTLEYVARTLAPVLGSVDTTVPVWLKPLDKVLQSAQNAKTLNELLHGGILEQGRKIKIQSGGNYFLPVVMVSFARFSFLMRRSFFRLMHQDLNAIFDGLRELEQKGVTSIDCRRAQFSADEPILRLRMICQSWKVMFQAEYSSGQPLRMLVDLRAAIDDALGRGTGKSTPGPTKAASAPARKAVAPAPTAKSAAGAASPASKPAAPKLAAKAAAAAAPAKFNVTADQAPPDHETLQLLSREFPRVLVIAIHENWPDTLIAFAAETLRRIDAVKRAERAEQLNLVLKRNATLGQYVIDMRHSLNNALTSVLGNAELLLLEPGAFTADVRSQLDTIRHMSLRMHEILQRFSSLEKELSFAEKQSRNESGARPAAAAAQLGL
jgi:hypothetical protein